MERPVRSNWLVLGMVVSAAFMLLQSLVFPVYAAEPALTEVLTNQKLINATERVIGVFPAGRYNISLHAEFADYRDSNELSYYEVGTSLYNVVFTGVEGGSGYLNTPMTRTFSVNGQIGLSLLSVGPNRFFTEVTRNPDGVQHSQLYRNSSDTCTFWIGFEDLYGGGDKDYQDMVISMTLQHYLSVVTLYGVAGGLGWHCNGTTAFASLPSGVVDFANGTRKVFTHWGGDASGTDHAKSNPILMDQNKTAIANWKTQHYLTVGSDPAGIVTIPGEGWYDAFTSVPLSAPSVPSCQFSYWKVDGESQGMGVDLVNVNMSIPHTAIAYYSRISRYTLTIQTTSGGTTSPAPGAYPFASGSVIQVTALPIKNYTLVRWELDGQGIGTTNPYLVIMNANHTLKAVFAPFPLSVHISPLYLRIYSNESVDFTSMVTGGITPYEYQWYLDDNPYPGAISNAWTFTPNNTRMYFVHLKVTDSLSATARSETGTLIVMSIPVGGYATSLASRIPWTNILCYTMLLAFLSLATRIVRRKAK